MALLLLPASVSALGALSQGFTTADGSLSAGSLVSLNSKSADVVEKATSDHALQLVGITADKPLVALGGGNQKAQVVVTGLTPAMVSDINGDIKVGDKVTASPIKGVGMKAQESAQIVGTAETNLSDVDTTTEHVIDKAGKSTAVKVGLVSIQVNVTYYAAPNDKLNGMVPTFLVNVGSSIAGKDLSPLRVLIGFSSLLVGFVITGIMMQAAVRSGIISIGRNPLAHDSLRRSLLDVLVTSVGVLLVTITAFYLILTS
jgi:hypothetical protein